MMKRQDLLPRALTLGVLGVVALCATPLQADDARGLQAASDVPAVGESVTQALMPTGLLAPPISISDTFTSSSPTQTGRLTRNGVPSNCDAADKTFPGINDSTVRPINSYVFTNDTNTRQCVMVTYAELSAIENTFFQTYSTSFNPADIAANYLADAGSSAARPDPVSYSFNVDPGQTYVLVANQVPTTAITTPVPYFFTVRYRPAAGGNVVMLSKPIRIYDTRAASGAPIGAGTGPLAAASTTSIQVTGTAVGGVAVPAGSVAVVGNVTAVSPTGTGNLRLFPQGVTLPTVSTLNYSAGQTIANGVTVGLSSTGQMSIFVGGGGALDVIFDVTGYVMSPIG